MSRKIAVIGGGPAGIFAALSAAEAEVETTVFDKNSALGAKLALTGGGRGNITNDRGREEFIRAFYEKKNFIKKSFSAFDNSGFTSYLHSAGIRTISDEEGRILPESLSASELRDRLVSLLKKRGVEIKTRAPVNDIRINKKGFTLTSGAEMLHYGSVILATGGRSWPSTGSDGAGYRIAQSLGHAVNEPVPALTNLDSEAIGSAGLSGISLDACRVRYPSEGKAGVTAEGGLVFTHTGLSGPAVLDISRFVSRGLSAAEPASVSVDLLPGMTKDEIRSYFNSAAKKQLKQAVSGILPGKLALFILKITDTDGTVRTSDAGKKRIQALLDAIKSLRVEISGAGGWERAMVTSGGVETGEIDSVTMGSKIVPGLFFAGELIDIDGPTGGYNIQAAVSTGKAAGRSAAYFIRGISG